MEFCTERWLLARMYESDLAIVDCRSEDDFKRDRIPGALLWGGHVVDIAKQLGAVGIDESTRIVLYDDGKLRLAGSVYESIQAFGHPSIVVLKNGYSGWVSAGFPIQTSVPTIRIPTIYKNI
jgi:thiosulfate/3-mercaptopyruvate sulfurtransferase